MHARVISMQIVPMITAITVFVHRVCSLVVKKLTD